MSSKEVLLNHERIMVAVTGASGSIYAERLIHELLRRVKRVYLCVSETGKKVLQYELEKKEEPFFSLRRALSGELTIKEKDLLKVFQPEDYFAPVASGSSSPDKMVILPCSMGTLARIHSGVSSSLIERSADVVLKQKRPLILCPRETPLNENSFKKHA